MKQFLIFFIFLCNTIAYGQCNPCPQPTITSINDLGNFQYSIEWDIAEAICFAGTVLQYEVVRCGGANTLGEVTLTDDQGNVPFVITVNNNPPIERINFTLRALCNNAVRSACEGTCGTSELDMETIIIDQECCGAPPLFSYRCVNGESCPFINGAPYDPSTSEFTLFGPGCETGQVFPTEGVLINIANEDCLWTDLPATIPACAECPDFPVLELECTDLGECLVFGSLYANQIPGFNLQGPLCYENPGLEISVDLVSNDHPTCTETYEFTTMGCDDDCVLPDGTDIYCTPFGACLLINGDYVWNSNYTVSAGCFNNLPPGAQVFITFNSWNPICEITLPFTVPNCSGNTNHPALQSAQTHLNEDLIQAHPNPAKDLLNISLNKGSIGTYLIFDMNGSIIMKGNFDTKDFEVDVSMLSSGSYIIKTINSNENSNTAEKHFIIAK